MRYLSGPHEGMTRNVSKLDPKTIFRRLLEFGSDWNIDYSQATEDEKSIWYGFDVKSRIIRALADGRCVYYMGRAYLADDTSKVIEVAIQVLEDINRSAHYCNLEIDDEYGVVIAANYALN